MQRSLSRLLVSIRTAFHHGEKSINFVRFISFYFVSQDRWDRSIGQRCVHEYFYHIYCHVRYVIIPSNCPRCCKSLEITCTVSRAVFFDGAKNFIVSWRYKIYFDYILLNNHRLSAVIFPSIQTRLYVTITILLQICKSVPGRSTNIERRI